LGDETKKKSSTPVIANVPEPVVQASLGEQFTIALCKNGSVYFWGSMYDALSESSPTRLYIPGVPKIAKVSAGRHHAMLVDPDGWSYAVGSNRVGQLGDFTFISRKTPVFSTDIRDMKATVQIYHSGDSSITVFNGSAILWYTEEGVPDTSNFTAMDMSNIDSPVQRIIGGDEFTMLLTEKGTVFGTGANNFGNLGDGTKSESLVPVPLTMSGILYKKTINELFTAQRDLSSAVFAIASDNKLYGWGANALISCKDSNYLSLTPDVIELPNNYAVKQIAPAFGLVLLEDGNIYKCSGNHMSIYTNSKIPFSNETFESVHTFPDSAGLAAFTKKNNVVIVSSSKVIKSLSPMMMNYSSVEGDITVGVLKRDIKIDGELFDVASVDSMTLWKVDNAPRLIVVTKSGDTFISSSGTWKRFLETPVDIKRSTTSVLVFSNNTMLVYWALKDSPVIRSIPFPTSSTLAKLIAVERTSYGVSVIVWSCSKHFTGENCTTPICYGKSSNDRSVCSGNGKCTKPATCECQPLYKGENCQQLSALAFVLIALGGTAIAVVSLLVIILVLVYILNKAFIGIRSIIKQRRTEIEMNALLQESLLKDDVELTDWVIPLSEITLLEKISEGSFGLVFKGRYKNSDVYVYCVFLTFLVLSK
jgi:alpha-tubulin suppressor-like RCC1 family protein